MRMTMAQMEAFYWTARLGTVRAAAERLNVTQPSLSLRIREFERGFGIKLFHKVGRNLHLTREAAALRRQVEQIVMLGYDLERQAISQTGHATRMIRLGATDIFAMTTLSDLLERLDRNRPDMAFEISIAFSHALTDMLDAGDLDIAFLTNPDPNKAYRMRRLAAVPVAWMAPNSLLLPEGPLRAADFKTLPIFTNPAPSHLYNSIHAWFEDAGVWPRRVHTCNTLAVIAQLAVRRSGVTMLPLAMTRIDASARQLRPLTVEPEIGPHQMHAVYRAEAESADLLDVIDEAVALLAASPFYG